MWNKDFTHCAALVQGYGRKVDAFKQVVKGNTLAHSIFKEYHLKNMICKLLAASSIGVSNWISFCGGSLTLLGLIIFRFFSALST